MLHPPYPQVLWDQAPGKPAKRAKGLGNPQVQAGLPATEAALAPFLIVALGEPRSWAGWLAHTPRCPRGLSPADPSPKSGREGLGGLCLYRDPLRAQRAVQTSSTVRTVQFLPLTRTRCPTDPSMGPPVLPFPWLQETMGGEASRRLGSETLWSPPRSLWERSVLASLPSGCCPEGHSPGVWGLPAAACPMGTCGRHPNPGLDKEVAHPGIFLTMLI